MNLNPSFTSCEILCTEHENSFLYTEMVQLSTLRGLCWVRPVALKTISPPPAHRSGWSEPVETLYDLRHGTDLLLPGRFFRTALDIEVIPLLSQLGEVRLLLEDDCQAHQQLKHFIWQIWRAHPEAFPS